MWYAFIKIGVVCSIPVSVAVYEKQAQLERDTQIVKRDNDFPPTRQWEKAHPREAAEWYRQAAEHSQRLLQDLGKAD